MSPTDSTQTQGVPPQGPGPVTGGSGMVGMNIQYTQHCIDMMKDDEYVFISSQDCDLTNKAQVDQFF